MRQPADVYTFVECKLLAVYRLSVSIARLIAMLRRICFQTGKTREKSTISRRWNSCVLALPTRTFNEQAFARAGHKGKCTFLRYVSPTWSIKLVL